MNDEFDATLGARVAHLMYSQHAMIKAKQEKVNKFGKLGHPEMAATEQAELECKDSLVFLDDLMDLNGSYEAYKAADPKFKGAHLAPRVTKIAEYTKGLLKKLKVPMSSLYSSKSVFKAEKRDQLKLYENAIKAP